MSTETHFGWQGPGDIEGRNIKPNYVEMEEVFFKIEIKMIEAEDEKNKFILQIAKPKQRLHQIWE